jgi:serine/threonine-protein kinase
MSPEQIEDARTVDARTDVWSMGVLLVEMLTGVCPFQRDSQIGTLSAVLTENIARLDHTAPAVPRRVADAVERALQRRRGLRHPTIEAFLLELRGARSSPGATPAVAAPLASPPPRSVLRALPALVGGAALLAGLAAVRGLGAPSHDARAPATPATATPLAAPVRADASVDASAAPTDAMAPVDAPAQADARADAPPRARPAQRDAATSRRDAASERHLQQLPASEAPLTNGAMPP